MHDWLIETIKVDWESGDVRILLSAFGQPKEIRVKGLCSLIVPRRFDWGPSEYVNGTVGPEVLENGHSVLKIEIQSGDQILVEGEKILLPNCD
ncbi:hypothetical protein [uncultured Roseobacter sp.]|uniref:hypothetical protein n=1 Tax=uncultured Roseobacter sp. TaxID=114847 RepID=UPI00262F487A|nr:hypothetical protein [uncultured Roseobacter sp.]